MYQQPEMFPNHKQAGASLSPCGKYRYELWREWGSGNGTVVFIGLNPSTADAIVDDPTIRRCRQFAMDWGFRRLEMVNLFAFRATSPAAMKNAKHSVGPKNNEYLSAACARAQLIVAAWGNHGTHLSRDVEVLSLIAAFNPQCFGVTSLGNPIHPLYQPKTAALTHL